MEPGITAANLAQHTAGQYQQATPPGRVCVVLGTGNVTSVSPLDLLYK